MKKIFCLYLTLLYCLVSEGIVTGQSGPSSKGETYALIVGIAQYENKNIPAVRYADKDAGFFAGYLKSGAAGAIAADHIRLLTNEAATVSSIYDAMQWLEGVTKENDLVYFYFSGHGDLETKERLSLGYLLAYNSPPNNYRNNAITIENLNRHINTLSLKNKARVILITDACHPGKLAGNSYKGKNFVAGQLCIALDNEVRLTACAAHEEAAEGLFWDDGRGAFSYYLLSGLNDKAARTSEGIVTLNKLKGYLDSAFATDAGLLRSNHKQTPVLDGNPDFPLARRYAAAPLPENVATHIPAPADRDFNTGTPSQALGQQPIDYFFELAATARLDTALRYSRYLKLPPEAVPARIIADYLDYLSSKESAYQQLALRHPEDEKALERCSSTFFTVATDTLGMLLQQVQSVKAMTRRFNERYVMSVQDKAQAMINAYLKGDMVELERRQYYYSGSRTCDSFLVQMKLAQKLIPEDHYLANVLKIQHACLAGLCIRTRLSSATVSRTLLRSATGYQRLALQYDAYAPYIHNELGHLFFHDKKYDSAEYHFRIAIKLAPAWAIPWSNLARLQLGLNRTGEARQAMRIADSLQPDLAYIKINAGLAMEQDNNWLAAESYYLQAISQNKVHYLPYERLGQLYLRTGLYDNAGYYLYQAKMRKDKSEITEETFRFGIEPGNIPPARELDRVDSLSLVLKSLYLDAAKHEKKKKWSKAFESYAIIAGLENEQQTKQAAFKGLSDLKATSGPAFAWLSNDPWLIAQYEQPVKLGGVLKASRLHESLGQYKEAEALLLAQVAKNREDGYLRQKMLDAGIKGPAQAGGPDRPLNLYWLNINLALESELYNFYKRRHQQSPRDFEWYQHAGLFLHGRLALSFNQVPVPERTAFYQCLTHYAYPFLGGGEPHKESGVNWTLPGTAEQLTIPIPVYDPLSEGLLFLQQGAGLSGNVAEDAAVTEATADLNTWMGNEREAIRQYDELVRLLPENAIFRQKLADRLLNSNYYTEAKTQLSVLNKSRKLNRQQGLQLAALELMSRQFADALHTLNRYPPADKREEQENYAFLARCYLLQEQYKPALAILKDSLRLLPYADTAGDEENKRTTAIKTFKLYGLARTYALLKQNDKAMNVLKFALEENPGLAYLLTPDDAWNALRKTGKWKQLTRQYPADESVYKTMTPVGYASMYNTVRYRIPEHPPAERTD